MRKVIGIGETILDIVFKNNQPTKAVPGGSVFNGLISLGRAGVDTTFISEVGNDRVGKTILDFMKDNGVNGDHVCVYPDSKSPVSLAFLNEQNDAEYIFYKDYPSLRLDVELPEVNADDIVMFGSFYAISPQYVLPESGSRIAPPRQVAAPPKGSISVGWLCVSFLKLTSHSSVITPLPSL